MNKILHFSSLYLLSSFLFILSLFITNQNLQAQTVLSQGDIAVIGVNANNGSCAPLLTGEDKISFVCFKPITTNTQICITDCAYISSTNTWAENEGLACMTYTGGATIAAGTIITFSSSSVTPSATNNPYVGTYPVVAPGTGAMPYAATPGTWSFSTPTPPYVGGSAFNVSMNMNVGGDQIYFMQGGTWTNPAGANNATYPAANVLYGFSTTTTPGFVAGAPVGTGQSNLVPSLECNVMAPSSATDWSLFNIPTPAPTTQAGWISAINNPANWPSLIPSPSCSSYNTTFAARYPSGTLFSPPTPPGVLPSGLLTAIPAVAICGTVPLSGYDLTQNNAAIIGSSGILSANVYWYTADPSQGTNANTTKIPAPTSYTFASASVTLYVAEAPTLAASTTKRCNTVAVTFNISTPPTLTVTNGFRCNGVSSLLTNLSVNPSAGATVNWYAASSGGASLGTGNAYTPSPLPTSNTTYYAEATLAGGLCPVRVPVQLYVVTCESSCNSTSVTPTHETCPNTDDGTATINFVPQGSPVFFTPLATGGVSALHNYLWNDPAPAQTANPATALAPGNYQVTITGGGTIWSNAITAAWTYAATAVIGNGLPTTTNGTSPNAWVVGTGEPGPPSPIAAGGICATGPFAADATLKISTVPNPASTASYNAGVNNVTSVVAISPTFSTVGFSAGSGGGLRLVFDYMEVSQNTVDNMTVYYSPDGTNWVFLSDPASTYNAGCAIVNARWDTWTVNLPVSANNNPNNKIAFVWVNNGDNLTGKPSAPPSTTISCAINNVRVLHSCTYVQSTTINAAPNFTVALSSSAASACENGTAPTLTATPTQAAPVANGPYNYAWEVDNGTTVTPIANNAATLSASTATAGTYTYTVTVTNTASGCAATDNVVVTINPLPTVDLGVDQIDCNSTGFTGIDLDAGGGFTNYQWSNGTSGATAQTINVTTSNTYTVTVTNSGGCISTDAVVITINQPPAVTAANLSTTPSNCGVDNGTITFPSPAGVTVETGSGFLIGGANITGNSPLTALGSGNYTLVYTDDVTGCFTNVTVNVGSSTILPPTPTINPASSTICINGSVPSLTASPNGAASTSWQWYGPNNSATLIAGATNVTFNPAALVDNTTAGATTFYVTNTVAGCESLPASVNITVQDPPVVSITSPSGSDVCSGASITLDADNIAGATYNWSGGGGSTSSATYTPTAPPATVTYTVTVTDGPCTVTPNFVVTVNPNPTAGTLTPTQAICSAANGQIAFTTPAGVTQVLYSTGATFNTGVNTDVTGASPVTDLAAGQYTFRFINGATNCFVDASINLTFIATAPPPTVAAVSAICFTGNDASNPTFSATAGGTLVSTYQWYGPAATPAAATAIVGATSSSYAPTVTAPNTYTYYVTNTIGGCESTRTPVSFTINALPTPSISGNTVVCSGAATNTLTASAASSYLWGDGSTNQTINGIGGSYAVTVTDANGCQSATAISVAVNNPVSVTINPDPASFCAGGSIILNAGTGFDTYAWSPAVGLDFTNIAAPTCTGTNLPAPYSLSYNVTVTKNENGISCSATDNISVSVTANPNLTATSSQTITACVGSTANLNNVTYTNSGAAGTQFFTDPIGDPVLSPSNVPVSAVGTTIYTLTETVSGTGCSDTLQIRVNGVAGITTSNFNANCNIAGTQYVVSFNMSGGTGVYTVTPAGSGTVTGNLFTSNPINTGTGYNFTINSTGATCLPATVGGSAPPCTPPVACNTIGCVGTNLVVNGNFESFNAATPFSTFTSSYDYSPCPGLICTNGATGAPILCQYDFSVQTSPNSCNTDFSANIHDHTTGSGNLMLVDYPAGNVGIANHIWCQTVTLAPATNYCFGAYMINILPTGTNQGLPAVNFTANGTLLGNSGNIPENEQWGYYGYSFNSGAGGSYLFCIDNSNFGAVGYDIAIDDITIAPLTNGTPPTAVNDAAAICSSAASINIPVLTNDSGTFSNSTLSIYSAPPFTDGTITGVNTATGTITFTPLPGFTGTSFQYKICDASGSCCSVATVNITLAATPTITTTVAINTACLTPFTGAATVTAPTGAGVTYLWSDAGASTTAGITAQNAGTYTVTVTGANGCNNTATATITSTPTLPVITLSAPTANTSCTSPFTGAVAVTAPTGAGVSYLWSDAGASTTAGITAQNAGTYTVTVTTANGCNNTATATITSTPTLPVITLSAPTANTSCASPFTGAVAVTAPTGAGVSYLWSDAGASTTAGITAQNAGTYTVTVTTANGCNNTATATITSTPTLPVITLSAPTANTSCASPFTGAVAVTAPTGAGVSYLWSDAGASTTAGITAQNAGTYTVTVTGANGCNNTATATITSTPTLPVITLSVPTANTSCASPFTGAVAVTAPTGAGVSYLWSDAGASTTAGITAQNAGTYTVTVTTANGCNNTATATITSTPTLPVITLSAPTANTSCASPFTGAVAVTAPTGAGVSYLWSDAGASTTAGITAQNAGTYTVTVTGANGCNNTATATITSTPTLPVITLSVPTANTSCASPFTGAVAVTAPTGAGVSYLWSDAGASTTAGITAQNAGTYTVTVTGTNGCNNTATATITSTPTLPVITLSAPTANTSCASPFTGAVAVTAPVGATYAWTGGATTAGITAQNAGTYTVTVTGANGCNNTATATITSTPTLPVANISGTNTYCLNSVATNLTASGGNTYLWNTTETTAAITPNTTPVGNTTYTVTVTAANGCIASATQIVTVNSLPTINVVTSCGAAPNTGAITTTATAANGGTLAYTINGTADADGNQINLSNNPYTVVVTETPSGCSTSSVANVNCGCLPIIVNGVASICSGAAATTYTQTGGVAGGIWSVSPATAGSINAATGVFTPASNVLSLINATITYTASGCNGILPVTINPLPTPTIGGATAVCIGNPTTLTANSGISYQWQGGPATATYSVSPAITTTYTVTVTDANSCSATATAQVSVNALPNISNTTTANTACLTPFNGAVDLSVLPVGSYNFVWSNGPTTEDLTVVQNGTYTVTVTNAATLCSTTSSVTVANNSAAPTTTNTTTANTACLTPFNGAVDLSVLPVGSYNFVWSNGPTTEDLTAVQNGTYTVTVTNAATLCNTTSSVTVANNSAAPTTTNTTTANTACLTPFNGAVDLSVLPVGSYNFVWSNSPTTEDLAAVQNGTYTVTVTNPATLCSTTTSVTVANNSAAPTASTTVINNTNCGATGNGSIDLSVNPAGTYAYFWSGGQATEDLSALSAGSYTVTVTNTATLCSATATATINNTPNLPTASTTVINNTNCGSTGNGSIDLSVLPAGTYAYFWSGGQATEDISALSAGTYTVTVTNTTTLCNATATATLSNTPNLPTASTTVINNTNCGSTGNGSIDLSVNPAGTYAYFWSGGQATEDLSALSAGTYTVTVTNTTTLCSATATASISNNTVIPTASITGVNTYCLNDVASSLTASGGGTYAWSTGGTGTTITPSTAAAGSIAYTVTVTSANNCTSTATAAVTVNALPAASISGGNICEGSPLNLTASGGSSYNWSGNGVTTAAANPQVINGLTPSTSTYNVTVTGGNGCTSTASTSITVNANPTASISGSSTFCVGGNSVLTASGGGTYQWAASNGGVITGSSTGSGITVNTAGTYAVTVTNNGCIGTASIAVTQATSLSPNITGNTQICPGTTTSLNAGSGFSSYLWSASAGTAITQSVNNIGVGTYSVTVSDVSGCTGTASTNVIQLNPTATATNTGTVCQGGTVNLNASVGTAYSWSGPAFASTLQNPVINIPNNAPANSYTYTVTVTDSDGCTATATTVVVVNALPTASISGSTSICSGGTANINFTGTPDAIVTYTINGGSNQTVTLTGGTATVSTGTLAATTTYTLVSVVSAAPASCPNTASGNAVVTVNPLPTASISGSTSFCSGGSANVTITGTPNAIVTYTINGGSNQTATLNAAGTATINTGALTTTATYTLVSVVSAAPASCTNAASGSAVISVDALPNASAGGGGNVCSASTINLSASGGTTYNWSGGGITASTQNQQNPIIGAATVGMSGTYVVTVTDVNGCTDTASTTVTVAPCACPNPPTVSGLSTATICAGLPANLSVTLGGGATIATWTTSGSGSFSATTGTSVTYTPSAADIAAGSVTITITTDDPDGAALECSVATTTTTVSINALPTAAISGTNTLCAGDNTTLTASGGNAYSWTLPNGGGTSSANPLNISNATNTNAGVYAVTVTNANNCTAVANTTVTVNALPTATAGGATVCVGDAINLTSSGGTTYSWSGSGITASTQDQQNPSIAAATAGMAGIYTVTVSNGNCSSTATTTVTVNANPVGAINGTLSFCEGGSTTLTATGGSSYTWAGAGIGNASQASQIISGLSNGTYPYNVTVSNGSCTATATATVTVFASPVAQITGSATFCAGGNTTLDAGAGYASYLWTPGNQNTQTITLSASGSPTVVVTDANGCTASDQITVTSGTALTPNITGDLTICAGQTAILSAGNGFDTYLWSPNGETTFEITVTPAVTTTYSVAVTQASCNGTASQQVVVQVPVAINAGLDDFICGYSYALNSDGTNGQWTYVGAQSVVFANALDPQTTVTVNACGVYEFIWTETSGVCQSSDTVQIGFADSPTVVGTCPPETEEVCGNSLGITPASVVGSLCSQSDCPAGSAAYEAILTQLGLDCTGTTSNCHWEWTYLDGPQTDATVTFTPDANTQNVTVNVVPFGHYTFRWVCDVTGTDPSCPTACGAIYAEKIFNFIAPLQANATAICNPSPSTDYVVTVNITGGVPPYTIPNGFSETLASGVPYNYLIDDASTCPPVPLTGSQNCTIVCPTITPTILGNVAFCVGSSIVLSVAEPFVGYQWTGGVGQTLSVSAAGSYTVTVTDSNGCTGTASVLVVTTPPTTPTFAAIAPICSGDVAPVLPAVSIEGIAGSWLPAVVSNTASGTYTFTPAAGACASTATVNVTVNPQTLPAFAAIAAICSGDVAPILPATSSNGISGTWLPVLVSNTASGAYTFTPSAGSCASTATVNVTVNASPQISVSNNCTGATADVTVTIVSGTPTTYSLDSGTAQASTTFAGVANGNHTIVATDANGCSDSEAFATNCVPGCPTITVTGSQSVCAGTTAVYTQVGGVAGGVWSVVPAAAGSIDSGGNFASSGAFTGNATITYTDNSTGLGCAGSIVVVVNAITTPTFAAIAPICSGDVAPILPATSSNGISGTWSPALVSNTTSGTYTFTPAAGACASTATVNVTVNPQTTPTFAAIAPICSGDIAPVLPAVSIEGIAGSWLPAVVSNTASGTYTFTPNAGACASTATINVTVNPQTTPTFAPIAAICSGDVAPVLPAVSIEGIAGSWLPALVSNTSSGAYTFTPNAGSCASTATVNVTVNPQTLPTFAAIAAICSGDVAPILPATSSNGITGTWLPAVVSNTASGTYTFTPAAGSCASTATVNVTVNASPQISVSDNCTGATADVTVTIVSGNPTNFTLDGTVGTSPFTGVANGNHTIVATDANGCSDSEAFATNCIPGCPTITVTGSQSVCAGATAVYTQAGGVAGGVWSVVPAAAGAIDAGGSFASSGAFAGNATITYTDNSTGLGCAGSIVVAVDAASVPTFAAIAPICSGDVAPVLPAVSIEGIAGTWLPAVVSNTASGTYTFTPAAGACASTASVDVTVNPPTTPTFAAIAPICSGDIAPVLPATSSNGISGSWLPAVVSNTASGTYTFTPSAGSCASTATINVTVNPQTTPTFAPIAAICSGDVAPILSTTSSNGITGTWLPAVVSNTASGTYTFTPAAGSCASTATVNVTVNASPQISVSDNCTGATADVTVTIVSGTPTTYSLDSGTSQAGTTFAGVANGNHTIVATDANGCSDSQDFITNCIPGCPTITVTGSQSVCAGATAVYTQAGGVAGGVWSVVPAAAGSIDSGGNFASSGVFAGNATITYTDNSTGLGCAGSIVVAVDAASVPTFAAIAPICSGDVAPVLPTTSSNGISGSWLPALVSNTASGTYTFTPNAGSCASTTTVNVTVNPQTTPTFTAIAPICSGDVAPVLPAVSIEGIAGSWLPAVVSNTASGTYTFTPAAGACASTATINVTVNQSPTVNITGTLAICEGTTTTLDAGTGFDDYTWSNGGSSQTITVGAGTHTVTVTDNGCTTTDQVTVTATALPTNVSATNNCTSNSAATITVAATAAAGTTLEYSLDGTNYQAANIFTDVPNGGYTVSVRVVGTTCSVTADISFNCACLNPPTLTIQDVTVCEGVTADLATTIVTNTGSAPAYYTNSADANAANATGLLANPSAAPVGIYYIRVEDAIDPACFTVEAVTVAELVIAPPTVTGLNNPYCVGETVDVLTATPNQGGTITWYANTDLTLVVATGNTYTPPTGVQAGAVSYWVAENANGCQGPATQVDVVFEVCVTCNVQTPIGVITELSTCEGTTNTSALEVTNNDPNATIHWYDATNTEVATGASFVPSIAGTYTAVAIANNDPTCQSPAVTATLIETTLGDAGFVYDEDTYCQGTTNITPTITGTNGGSFSATGGLVINPTTGTFDATTAGTFTITYDVVGNCPATNTFVVTVIPSITITISSDETVLTTGESTQLTAIGATTYTWTANPTLSCTDCANPVATPTQTTTYTVQTAGNECAEPASITIVVNPAEPELITPSAFSPNNDGVNDVFRAIYTSEMPENFSMRIYDRWGVCVFESTDLNYGWDGTFKGFDSEIGVYAYTISYNFTGKNTKFLSGNITLVR